MKENCDILVTKILEETGEYGRFQKFLTLAMIPLAAAMINTFMAQAFIIVTPQVYWCKVPQLIDKVADPRIRRDLATPIRDGKWQNCFTFDTDWDLVISNMMPPPDDTPIIPCKHGFEFQFEDIKYANVVTERQWVCDLAENVRLSQVMFFVGAILGAIIIGCVGDLRGRITALVYANALAFIGCIFTVFTKGFWDFVICRTIAGLGHDNCYFMMYIILVEYVGPNYRPFAALISMALFCGGCSLILPLLAYVVSDWRLFTRISSIPMLSVSIIPFLVPESARWSAARGQSFFAARALKTVERSNRVIVSHKLISALMESKKTTSEREWYLAVLRSMPLCSAIVLVFICYTTCSLFYDCVIKLSVDVQANFFISFSYFAPEIPANVFLAFYLDRIGRIKVTSATMGIAGIVTAVGAALPINLFGVVAVFSRTIMGLALNTLILWITEILPTPVRASGSSMIHIGGHLTSIGALYITYNDSSHEVLLLILSMIAFVGATTALCLPETTRQLLPQMVSESEEIFRKNSRCYRGSNKLKQESDST